MCIKHVYPNTLQVSSIKLISSVAGLLASLCSLLPDEERSLVFAETRARSILPCQVLALTKTKNQESQKIKKDKIKKVEKSWRLILSAPCQRAPSVTLKVKFNTFARWTINTGDFPSTILWKDNNRILKDSLCLPRDRSLTTRSLLEEGEYSPRDLLILDNQVVLIILMPSLCFFDHNSYQSITLNWLRTAGHSPLLTRVHCCCLRCFNWYLQ